MWVCNAKHCFFIVWNEGHKPLYEKIDFDIDFCDTVVNNITIFYKSFVLPCLLGFCKLCHCPKCEKLILENDEANATEKKVCCDMCSTFWHVMCAGLSEVLEGWICPCCLVDAASRNTMELEEDSSSDEDTMDLDSNPIWTQNLKAEDISKSENVN